MQVLFDYSQGLICTYSIDKIKKPLPKPVKAKKFKNKQLLVISPIKNALIYKKIRSEL